MHHKWFIRSERWKPEYLYLFHNLISFTSFQNIGDWRVSWTIVYWLLNKFKTRHCRFITNTSSILFIYSWKQSVHIVNESPTSRIQTMKSDFVFGYWKIDRIVSNRKRFEQCTKYLGLSHFQWKSRNFLHTHGTWRTQYSDVKRSKQDTKRRWRSELYT